MTVKRLFVALMPSALLAGCAGTPPEEGPSLPQLPAPPRAGALGGLDTIMGHDADFLTDRLGRPAQDLREANGRRLQFVSGGCVLDAYLYPPSAGREPVVRYIDTRLP
ncbi:MAG: hypothetical protein KGQ42_00620, partial [Alphaproteobacteria bacterium]|nr:hypothetical protein [Alphaproteobacteria bacterium]